MREKDDQDLRLIELNTPVKISDLCLIDCKQVTVQLSRPVHCMCTLATCEALSLYPPGLRHHIGNCLPCAMQGKAQEISVTNCHFHDGLNCGIDCKGARKILIANNVVERTRMAGVNAAEDHWWAEGGMAGARNFTTHLMYAGVKMHRG